MKGEGIGKPGINVRQIERDWKAMVSFLSEGWKEKAKELGALSRNRKFTTAEALLRVLLTHIGCGCSLRVTLVLSKESGLADISDVALLKRLKACGDWFSWMAWEIMEKWNPPPTVGKRYNCRLVDGTTVEELGTTETTCKIHFSFKFGASSMH
jgi:hypothetical protein